jgi:hypothetical protein
MSIKMPTLENLEALKSSPELEYASWHEARGSGCAVQEAKTKAEGDKFCKHKWPQHIQTRHAYLYRQHGYFTVNIQAQFMYRSSVQTSSEPVLYILTFLEP